MNKLDSIIYKFKISANKNINPGKIRRALKLRVPIYEFVNDLAEKSIVSETKKVSTNKELLKLAHKISKQRPMPNTCIDQCPISDEDMVARVKLIASYLEPVFGKEILFVGDDDLASPLLFLLYNPKFTTLVDFDSRIIKTISKFAKQIRCVHLNLIDVATNKIKDPLKNKLYDCIVSDPPYTEAGYRLFLNFGLKHLKLDGYAFVAVSHMNLEDWSDELLFKVEELLLEYGCVIEEIRPNFAVYEHKDGVISSMVIARKVSKNTKQKEINLNLKKLYTTGYLLK